MNKLNELNGSEILLDDIGYLTDEKGCPSAVRLYGLICVISGALLAFLSVYLDSWTGATLAMALVGAAYTGKVVQKGIEKIK